MNVPFRHHKKASSSVSRTAQDAVPPRADTTPKISHAPGPGPNEYCPENMTMFQAFEWNCPKDQKHWTRLASALPSLKSIGIDNMWIPPGCKGGWHGSNGYDIYDLYDLGEFQQKDSKGTKWGTKDELVEMMEVARKCGVGVYWDAVLNHKAAADFSEPCYAVKVDPKGMSLIFLLQTSKFPAPQLVIRPFDSFWSIFAKFSQLSDRTQDLGKPTEIEAWTGFEFAGRKGRYSPMKYRWHHFTGTDYDHRTQSNGVFKFLGRGKKDWAKDVDDELGNYDYL
jgi:alpha-amylase